MSGILRRGRRRLRGDKGTGYRASKKYAELAGQDFNQSFFLSFVRLRSLFIRSLYLYG